MMDTKPRDFSYLTYKDRYPLELNGTMRQRQRPSTASRRPEPIISFGKNQVDRQKFAEQIRHNYQDIKSVLPVDLESNKKNCAIKTFGKQTYIGLTGAPYLMVKSNIQNNHPEKRHIESRVHLTDRKTEAQKKHFQSRVGQQTQKQWDCPKPHTSTLHYKINQDLYSNPHRRERAFSSTVRMSQRSMLHEGEKLGFEQQKSRRVSCAKHQELIGTYCQPLRNSNGRGMIKDDWRKSSIVLG